MPNVSAYLAGERAKPFYWGDTDCAMTADRWVQALHGFSPMARYGRVHTDESAANLWLDEMANLAVETNRIMRASGFSKTHAPVAGDVGIILSGGRLCVALYDGAFWHSRDSNGFVAARDCWKAWGVVCRKP